MPVLWLILPFLLLIFFLVTASIENDSGLNRMLPQEKEVPEVNIRKRNLFEISINPKNEWMVDSEIIDLERLRDMTITFLDNGGTPKGQSGFCGYCQGERSSLLSDNPDKAIISLTTSRNSDYAFYVSVQNEIIGAYNYLRNREGKRLFGMDYVHMVTEYNKSELAVSKKAELKEKIESLRKRFPLKFIEPENIHPN